MPTMAIPSVYAMFSKLDCDEQSSSTVVLPLCCKSNRSWLNIYSFVNDDELAYTTR